MYYSFKCTYCGRVFYTYDSSRERASDTLYYSIKKHLIDSDEDRKEYEMDDGTRADSDQIYAGMQESKDIPAGGYEATVASETSLASADSSSGSSSSSSSTATLVIVLILLAGVICLFIFFPEIWINIKKSLVF